MAVRFGVETKQDYAYRLLREMIVSGQLQPGQRIVVNRVAEDIGTSIIPVREAMVRLESEHLVTIKPHSGAVVALLTKDTVLMTLESLSLLEGYATRLAHPRAHEILHELRAATEVMREAAEAEDWEAFNTANRRFHFDIYGVCGNDVLVAALESLWGRLVSVLGTVGFALIPDRAPESIAEHERIMELLAAPSSDPLEIEMVARCHKMSTANRLAES